MVSMSSIWLFHSSDMVDNVIINVKVKKKIFREGWVEKQLSPSRNYCGRTDVDHHYTNTNDTNDQQPRDKLPIKIHNLLYKNIYIYLFKIY